MTLNLLFITVTIKRYKESVEETLHYEEVQKRMNDEKVKQLMDYRPY
ncbi:YrzI family small protein [Sutcliffiella cohnii]|nr:MULTISPECIES: YrzI family small protein [Sutcliffiella]MED4016443.1 YrzI family small protein [Sutcliffiella cohnii]WBL13905.1 YrzI family small protein [Sutcliffiella sp. NC1]